MKTQSWDQEAEKQSYTPFCASILVQLPTQSHIETMSGPDHLNQLNLK